MATLMTDPTQKRKNTNLPYLQDPSQPLQLTNNAVNVNQPGSPAVGGNTATGQGQSVPPIAGADLNKQVLNKLQTNVLQGSNNPVMDQTEALTSRLLQNPTSMGNPTNYINRGMDQYNRSVAQQLESARRTMAPTAGLGNTQKMLLDAAFEAAQGRADTRRGLENEVSQSNFNDMIKAAAEGRATATTKGNLIQQGIQNLVSARGAAEGQEQRNFTAEQSALDRALSLTMQTKDIDAQRSLTELKGKIDSGMMLQAQDFEASQNALNRALQQAMQAGDIQGQKEITTLQSQLQAQRDEADRAWQTQERMATQGWQTGERLSSQDFTKNLTLLQSQIAEAAAQGDFERARVLQQDELANRLKMQTQDFAQQEKMAYLDSQLQEARASNDYDREIGIRRFQHAQDMEALQQQFGHDRAMAEVKNRFDLALQNNDFANMAALNQTEFEFRASEAAKDRVLESIGLQLQERGVSMQEQMTQWNRIQDAVEAGQLSPEAGFDYLRNELAGTGITVSQPNAIQDAMAASKMEYMAERQDFALRQPQYVQKDANGQPVVNANGEMVLTAQGEKALSDYMSRTYYNPQTSPSGGGGGGSKPSGGGVGSTVGGAVGSVAGGALGSLFGPLGTAAGSFVGGKLGGWVGGLFGK